MKKMFAIAVVASSLVLAQAQIQYNLTLTSAQEVPVNNSTAIGIAQLTLNPNNTLSYNITYSGLAGDWTASHIHGPALAGANASVIFPFSNTPTTTRSGVLSGTTPAFSSTQLADFLGGRDYLNIHSTLYPGGEIRAQVLAVPEPSTIALFTLGALVLVRHARRRS
jgi:hypothetical protein